MFLEADGNFISAVATLRQQTPGALFLLLDASKRDGSGKYSGWDDAVNTSEAARCPVIGRTVLGWFLMAALAECKCAGEHSEDTEETIHLHESLWSRLGSDSRRESKRIGVGLMGVCVSACARVRVCVCVCFCGRRVLCEGRR